VPIIVSCDSRITQTGILCAFSASISVPTLVRLRRLESGLGNQHPLPTIYIQNRIFGVSLDLYQLSKVDPTRGCGEFDKRKDWAPSHHAGPGNRWWTTSA